MPWAPMMVVGLTAAVAMQMLVPAGIVTAIPAGRLGGVSAVLLHDMARPDRYETAFTFLAPGAIPRALPGEVRVRGRDGGMIHLSAQEGMDCTLSAVLVLPAAGGRGAVVSAVRRFLPILTENDYSAPAPMAVQVYRPRPGGGPGESAIVLRAVGRVVLTPPLCTAADVTRAMAAARR